MTQVNIKNDGEHFEFLLNGHAGDDAVCNAISMLTYSVACYIDNTSDLIEKHTFEAHPGYALITFNYKKESSEIVRFLTLAICNLEYTYPSNIVVTGDIPDDIKGTHGL